MEKNKVGIYSIIKLVRKQAGTGFNTPGALSHNEAYVYRINTKYNFIDVTYKHKKHNRDIRMFWNDEDQTYVYFDNDNNTKLYYYKNITHTPTKAQHKKLENTIGIHYELEKYSNDDYENLVFYAKTNDMQYMHYHSKNRSHEWELNHSRQLLAAFAKMGGLDSTESMILVKLKNTGYNLALFDSLKEIFTIDELNVLQKIIIEKFNAVKIQDYETAANLREKEVEILIKYKTLLNFNNIKIEPENDGNK